MVSLLNLTVLRLSVGCCTSISPLFSCSSRGAVRYSRFWRFTSVLSLNSFSELQGCQFRDFLNSPVTYASTCKDIGNQEFYGRMIIAADSGSCVSVQNCGFYNIHIEASSQTLGGAISCSSVNELHISGSQFSSITLNGVDCVTKGTVVYFDGKIFDFSSNCVTQTGQSDSIIESTADTQTMKLNSFLDIQFKQTLITIGGHIEITHLNVTNTIGLSSSPSTGTLILITSTATSLVAGEITTKQNSDVKTLLTIKTSAAVSHSLDSYVIKSISQLANIQAGDWTITRAWVTGATSDVSCVQDGTITFSECYFQSGGAWEANVGVMSPADAASTQHRTIQQLALGSCRTELPRSTIYETWKMEGEAIGYLAGSIIGGIACGVTVFVGLYFGLKAAHRWYEKRKDRQYPGFNV